MGLRRAETAELAERRGERWKRRAAWGTLPLLVPLWHRQRDAFYEPTGPEGPPSGVRNHGLVGKILLDVAALDWLLLGYLFALFYLVLTSSSPARPVAVLALAVDLCVFCAVLAWVRRTPA